LLPPTLLPPRLERPGIVRLRPALREIVTPHGLGINSPGPRPLAGWMSAPVSSELHHEAAGLAIPTGPGGGGQAMREDGGPGRVGESRERAVAEFRLLELRSLLASARNRRRVSPRTGP
jgi:hypothetical protein